MIIRIKNKVKNKNNLFGHLSLNFYGKLIKRQLTIIEIQLTSCKNVTMFINLLKYIIEKINILITCMKMNYQQINKTRKRKNTA